MIGVVFSYLLPLTSMFLPPAPCPQTILSPLTSHLSPLKILYLFF